MESNKAADGSMTPLAARNIDTGLGLERMAQILQVPSLLSDVMSCSICCSVQRHVQNASQPAGARLALKAQLLCSPI